MLSPKKIRRKCKEKYVEQQKNIEPQRSDAHPRDGAITGCVAVAVEVGICKWQFWERCEIPGGK